jgi:hypothetical protein
VQFGEPLRVGERCESFAVRADGAAFEELAANWTTDSAYQLRKGTFKVSLSYDAKDLVQSETVP